MAVLKLDRIVTAPAGAAEMLASRAALAAAVKNASPGLVERRHQAGGGCVASTDKRGNR